MSVQTIDIPHLGGIEAAYQMPSAYDSTKPTLVLVHSLMTSSELYRSQFKNKSLTDAANLVAVDLLGHGHTRAKSEHFTYWDSAIMTLQIMEKLKIGKFFVLGTSQGGWIAVRMALLAPEKVCGVIPLGTSMDYESERTRQLGSWDVMPIANSLIDGWTSQTPTPDFQVDPAFCNVLIDLGMGKDCDQGLRDYWVETVQKNYQHDDGRKRARMACINLRDRDGLHGRLFDVRCPVLWLHGTADTVYSAANAEEEIKLFVNSPDARVSVIAGGQHFLSATHPQEVDAAVIQLLRKYS